MAKFDIASTMNGIMSDPGYQSVFLKTAAKKEDKKDDKKTDKKDKKEDKCGKNCDCKECKKDKKDKKDDKKPVKKKSDYEMCFLGLSKISEMLDDAGLEKAATYALMSLNSLVKSAEEVCEDCADAKTVSLHPQDPGLNNDVFSLLADENDPLNPFLGPVDSETRKAIINQRAAAGVISDEEAAQVLEALHNKEQAKAGIGSGSYTGYSAGLPMAKIDMNSADVGTPEFIEELKGLDDKPKTIDIESILSDLADFEDEGEGEHSDVFEIESLPELAVASTNSELQKLANDLRVILAKDKAKKDEKKDKKSDKKDEKAKDKKEDKKKDEKKEKFFGKKKEDKNDAKKTKKASLADFLE